MSYNLYYANLNLNGDIPCYQLASDLALNGFLLAEANCEGCVYLVSINDEEFVCDHILKAINFIGKNFQGNNSHPIVKEILDSVYYVEPVINVFVQEYSSYEEAYKVALHMKECSPLCYSSTPDR